MEKRLPSSSATTGESINSASFVSAQVRVRISVCSRLSATASRAFLLRASLSSSMPGRMNLRLGGGGGGGWLVVAVLSVLVNGGGGGWWRWWVVVVVMVAHWGDS